MPPKKALPTITSQPGSSANTNRKRKMDPNAQKYYAVRAGKRPGIYLTWLECQAQTAGFRGAQYKSFLSREDAEAFVEGRNLSTATDGTQEVRYYAVAVGRDPGIYTDWEAASLAIKGWKGPKYKRFDTREDALEFIRVHGDEAAQEMLREEEDIDIEPPRKKTKKGAAAAEPELNVQCIYTDGSSRSNGRAGAAAGVGVYFGAGDPRNISEPLEGEVQTNQRAELTAILRAVEAVDVTQPIRIYSDSKYSISCVTEWYKNWERNKWQTRDGPVKNKDLVAAIRARIEERDAAGTQTYFQWVKGHASEAGNIAADNLAVRGAKRS